MPHTEICTGTFQRKVKRTLTENIEPKTNTEIIKKSDTEKIAFTKSKSKKDTYRVLKKRYAQKI